MDKLDFDTCYRVFEAGDPNLTDDELEEKTEQHLTSLYGAEWERPNEIEKDDFEYYAQQASEYETDEEKVNYLESEQLDERTAKKALKESKNVSDPYYSKLDEIDRRALKKMQTLHKDRNWTPKKYYEIIHGK